MLHYMTLPQLYSQVTLRSYAHIRYGPDERPEGCGSASPLAMGLNGLISRNLAGLVRSLKISGEWKEYDSEEFARVGRISDNSMMLNMVVRMAVEKMEKLESFRYTATVPAAGLLSADVQPAGSSIPRCFKPYITVWRNDRHYPH